MQLSTYYTAEKERKLDTYIAQVNLENIMSSEINNLKKDKHYTIPLA